jgi:hypothetical protein
VRGESFGQQPQSLPSVRGGSFGQQTQTAPSVCAESFDQKPRAESSSAEAIMRCDSINENGYEDYWMEVFRAQKNEGGSSLGSRAPKGRVPLIRPRRDRIMGSSILASLSEAGGNDPFHLVSRPLPPHLLDVADRVGTRPTPPLVQLDCLSPLPFPYLRPPEFSTPYGFSLSSQHPFPIQIRNPRPTLAPPSSSPSSLFAHILAHVLFIASNSRIISLVFLKHE